MPPLTSRSNNCYRQEIPSVFFTWNAAVEIHSQCNATIPSDWKNTNKLGDDWRVRKRVAYHRKSIGVTKEYLWDTKPKTRNCYAARCKHKMKVEKFKPDAKIDVNTPRLCRQEAIFYYLVLEGINRAAFMGIRNE